MKLVCFKSIQLFKAASAAGFKVASKSLVTLKLSFSLHFTPCNKQHPQPPAPRLGTPPHPSADVDCAAVALFKLSCCLFMHLLHFPTVYCCPNTNDGANTHMHLLLVCSFVGGNPPARWHHTPSPPRATQRSPGLTFLARLKCLLRLNVGS